MSWFEPGAFASLAKNAIKEAQKTIDKALDIQEDTAKDIYDPISPVIKKTLKEKSENFSSNFVLSERAENVYLTKDSTSHETSKSKESSSGTKLAGNLWGSFTSSFFDSPQNAADKGSSRSSSAPITPSDKVVATQPPRSVSGLPPSSHGLDLEYSSQSSSIIQLSMDNMPSSSTPGIQSPFMQETEDPFVTVEHSIPNVEDGTDRKEESWDWGWDSSIMVMSSDPKLKEDAFQSKSNLLLQEESLVDDDPEGDGFAKSRLIVGSVNSESSNSLPRESLNSLNSSRSLPEIDTLIPVMEDVFADVKEVKLHPHLIPESTNHPKSPDCRASFHDLAQEDPSLSERPGGEHSFLSPRASDSSVVESPDSIIILDSSMASPVDPSSAGLSKPYFLVGPLSEDASDPDLSTGDSVNSPTTPSSIEVLSTSTEVSSPPAAESSSYTLSDDLTSTSTSNSNTKKSSDYGEKSCPFTTDSPDGLAASKTWKTTTIVSGGDRHAITRQPLSSSSAVGKATVVGKPQEKANSLGAEQSEVVFFGNYCDGEDQVLDSCQSGSDLTAIAPLSGKLSLDSGAVSESPTESSSHASFITTPPQNLDCSGFVSMNAAEIRKKLDKVDWETESIASGSSLREAKGEEDPSLQDEDESIPSESSCLPLSNLLEMSSRSESSTDTVTASMDSQHMGWTDIGSIEILVDESECVRMKEETDEQEAMDEGEGAKSQPLLDEKASWPVVAQPNPKTNHPTNEPTDRELSPGSSDRSDVLKVDSSGHSSADEMETATSSDIEVISSPSIDGSSNGNSRSSSGVPSVTVARGWMTAPRGLRTFVNEKAEEMALAISSYSTTNYSRKENCQQGETVPSSMTTSFTSISESDGDSPHLPHSEILQLEASRLTQMLLQDITTRSKGHRRNESNFSETSESSVEPTSPEMEKLFMKINHLTEILESRETKVLELSHVNVSLQDANSVLKGRLEELEGLRKGSESTESMREEFTQRLVAMERKFQQALRDKETVKKQLEEYKLEVSCRSSDVDLARELEDRDVTISELRREGEKLSKQQLSYSNIVKKLRTKEKENDVLIQDQKEKIESLNIELERLRKQLRAKEEVERRQIDAIGHLTATTQRQADEIQTARADNAELEGKLSALKEALDTAYREMAELRRSEATRDAVAHKASLSAEIAARETVEAALAEERRRSHREQEALLAQIHELQEDHGRNEALCNRKERQMRGEIQDLLQRLSEAESRASEMSNSVSAATRPLLRQMENIQASQQAQQAAWEGMEDSLTKRLNEAQKLASASAKRESEAKENHATAMTELTSVQSQVGSLQTEIIQLKNKLEVYTLKAASLEEEKMRETNQLDALKASFAEEIKEVKHERDVLEQQLEVERTAATAEKKKLLSVQEQLKEKERKLAQLQALVNASASGAAGMGLDSHLSTPGSSPTPSLSRFSLSGSVNESYAGSHWGDDVFEPSWPGQRASSVYDSVRGNNAATVDILTSSLRQREGEVHHLQSELSRLEAHKESLAQELVQSSRRSEEFLEKVQEMEQMKEAQKDMDQKYNALLQMYGEKVEEVEELRLDLEDVKEMYKLQIDHLMQK